VIDLKLKKYFTAAVCAAVFLTVNVLAAEINVKINGTESTVSEAQSLTAGLKPGENSITVTYSEKMKKEEKSVTTIAALYCNGALEDVDVSHSIPIGVGGQIPHSDFTLTLPEGIDDYFVKVFFFEDFSKILPLKNKGKETSGTDLAENKIIVDGTEIPVNTQKQEFLSPDWIHIEDNNGYVFLDEGEVVVTREHNNGTSFAVITQEHGESPVNSGYSYVILPEATAEETEQYSQSPDVEIICADENVHAIRDLLTDTCYINVYEGSYTIDGITLPVCSAIIEESAGKINITVCDPTQKQSNLELVLSGKTVSTVTGADKDCVSINGSTVLVDVSGKRGASYSFALSVQ